MFVETNGPYVRLHGKAAEPRDVWQVVDYLALARSANVT
jgi:Tat protein secretion system quality control protein TatD with DNase activity